MTDEQLVRASQAGDANALETLYERYLPVIWRFACSRLGGDVHVAEDAPAGGFDRTSGVDEKTGIALDAASAVETRGFLSRSRFSRSGPYLERLEEEYARVVNLMESIQTHLAAQAERSDIMARSLDRLAEGLAGIRG